MLSIMKEKARYLCAMEQEMLEKGVKDRMKNSFAEIWRITMNKHLRRLIEEGDNIKNKDITEAEEAQADDKKDAFVAKKRKIEAARSRASE
ncbi:uncharacterized protein MONOS_18242 [Monocercomonoides exilis]|uniref:uncharacterized protein n=1 Tax=Monocercomonoides exilis TaxID=2049356 RepID=UPI00355AC59C|nr:hypothetical protein MONOS_18241 [Monocercomonoides exilis]KAH7816431.1 hypothetical protein MONOS_18242 [Monocercomonoides exilis]